MFYICSVKKVTVIEFQCRLLFNCSPRVGLQLSKVGNSRLTAII